MNYAIEVKHLSAYYGNRQVLHDVNVRVHEHEILAIIGPANSGKSTFLRCINRMADLLNGHARVEGSILIGGKNMYAPGFDVHKLRTTVGMIFPVPTPLPMSIFDNVAYGPRLHGEPSDLALSRIVEESLQAAGLWDEVKQRLSESAARLSGGQQQRLCLARALAVSPKIILFDEPCSGLDPISTAKVEASMKKLAQKYTIILVTNTIKQAQRVSDRTAFFYNGDLVEIGKTKDIFGHPHHKRTKGYISGKYG